MGRLNRHNGAAAVAAGCVVLLALVAGCGGGAGGSKGAGAPTAGPALPLERFSYLATLTLREVRPDGEAREVVISTEGSFQSPDRHAFTYTTKAGGGVLRQSAVLIGDQAWLRRGEEPWRSLVRDDSQVATLLSSAFSAVRPQFLGGPELERARQSVRRLPSTEESVNGVAADHYQVGAAGKEFFGALLERAEFLESVSDVSWDLWLASDGGWPVRLLANATITADLPVLGEFGLTPPASWELRVDVSRPNDPTLAVVAPEGGS